MQDPSFKQAKQSLNQKKNKANILSFWTELFDYLHVLVDTIINLFTGYEGDNKFIGPPREIVAVLGGGGGNKFAIVLIAS